MDKKILPSVRILLLCGIIKVAGIPLKCIFLFYFCPATFQRQIYLGRQKDLKSRDLLLLYTYSIFKVSRILLKCTFLFLSSDILDIGRYRSVVTVDKLPFVSKDNLDL